MREGDPTGKTGPTPMMLAQINYGGEDFWNAAKWPMFFILPMLDEILASPPASWTPKKLRRFKKIAVSDPLKAWQEELDGIRIAYNRWLGPKPVTLAEYVKMSDNPLVKSVVMSLVDSGSIVARDLPLGGK